MTSGKLLNLSEPQFSSKMKNSEGSKVNIQYCLSTCEHFHINWVLGRYILKWKCREIMKHERIKIKMNYWYVNCIDTMGTKWKNWGIETHYLLVFPSIGQQCVKYFMKHWLHVDISGFMLNVYNCTSSKIFSLYLSFSYLCSHHLSYILCNCSPDCTFKSYLLLTSMACLY